MQLVAVDARRVGDHKAELQYALHSLKVDEKSRPESESLANDLYNVGSAYQDLHRLAEAEPYYQRSLKIHEKISGPDHLDVASVVNSLAELYRTQGKFSAALPMYQRALKINEQAYGPDHPEVAINLNNLGLYYANLGQFSEALPLFQRAADIRDKTLGPEHPLTAHSQNALGGVNSDMGNYAEALQHYRALWRFSKKRWVRKRRYRLMLDNLGELYFRMGNYADGLPPLRRALAIQEKAFGPEGREVCASLNNLGMLYLAQGDFVTRYRPYNVRKKFAKKSWAGTSQHGRLHPQLRRLLLRSRRLRRRHSAVSKSRRNPRKRLGRNIRNWLHAKTVWRSCIASRETMPPRCRCISDHWQLGRRSLVPTIAKRQPA